MTSSRLLCALGVGLGLFIAIAAGPSAANNRADFGMPDTFSLAVLPDTQKFVERSGEFGLFTSQTHWLAINRDKHNIRFALHTGDIVDNSKREIEWERASQALRILDNRVPYVLSVGNHDLDGPTTFFRTRGTKAYNRYFPAARYEDQPWYGGRFMQHENDNYYVLFEHKDLDFMIVSLEFAPPNSVLRWANNLVAAHPHRRVIVLTHCYLDMFNARSTLGLINPHNFNLGEVNDGQQLWDEFVSRHKNIFMVISGHYPGVGQLSSTGVHGNTVYQLMANFQTRMWSGRYGWMRLMEFTPQDNTISVKTYSPYLDRYLRGSEHEFVLPYDMRAPEPEPVLEEAQTDAQPVNGLAPAGS
jgi:hypothetical protein